MCEEIKAKLNTDLFTKVGGAIAFSGNVDSGEYKADHSLRLIDASNGVLKFKSTPWGIGVVDLRVIYDTNTKEGCYCITPRFLFHGVEAYLAYPNVAGYALSIKMFKDIELADFLQIVQESIKISNIKFEMGDEEIGDSSKDFTLIFRGEVISRLYQCGSIKFKVVGMADCKVYTSYRVYFNNFDKDGEVTVRHSSSGSNASIKCKLGIACAV